MGAVTVLPFAAADVPRLRELWLALHHVHQSVSPLPLVADDDVSWAVRSALYARWLGSGEAFGLLVERAGRVLGYALCRLIDGPDDTFPVGASFGDLYSLSVAEGERGAGIGTMLLDAVDAELERRGVRDLRISVLAGNDRARALYERRGLEVAELALFRFGLPSGRRT